MKASSFKGISGSAGVNIEFADQDAKFRPFFALDATRNLKSGGSKVKAGPDIQSLATYRVDEANDLSGRLAAGLRYRLAHHLDLEVGVDGRSISSHATDWSFRLGVSRHYE